MFKLENVVGPLIENSIQDLTQLKEMMKEFHFELGEKWKYDPHQVIYDRRKSVNSAPYHHETRVDIECKENQDVSLIKS